MARSEGTKKHPGRKPPGSKPPSKKRYDESHRVRSCRLDMETDKRLTQHLDSIGCSFADFVKDSLGREKSMVEKRVEVMASMQVAPALEERVRRLEDLVHKIISITVDNREYPPDCPRCEGQELFRCDGRETKSTIAHPWVPTWKCPKCGYFIDTYKRIDPKSIKWIDPDSYEYIDKPKTSVRPSGKKKNSVYRV